ncbi:MAG TPA: NAD-dependent protein deacylase [Bacillus bacterium]|nr:NAD-dependent protein deacylase [Bacillus sp. (in: firmicutes)]
MDHTILTCKNIIKKSKRIIVLTGEGISTESGIRDFRSKSGLYRMAPEYMLSLEYFYENPSEFYQFAIENLYHPEAVPNIGHEILAKWEREGLVSHIITQNIDGLHQEAGSKNVIEFHGTMETASCMNCGQKYTVDEMAKRMKVTKTFYVCNHCEADEESGHYIKPDVVLFGDAGEWFTEENFRYILDLIQQADCLLVLGTSLNVTPFSLFPRYKNPDVPVIIINKGNTPFDTMPNTYVLQFSIGKALTEIDRDISQ